MTENRVSFHVWRALVDACEAVPCNIHLQERRPDVFVLEREYIRMRECEARLVNVGADWQLEEVTYRDSSRRKSDIKDTWHLLGLLHVAGFVLVVVAGGAGVHEFLVGLLVSALTLPLTLAYAWLVHVWSATRYAGTWSSMRDGLVARGWQRGDRGVWLPPSHPG